jgi:transcriptional regulator with XRE-family HTH domain
MGSSPVLTSKSVGKLLRRRREALGLSLREVARRSGGQGDAIPASTLVRIEQGTRDPGVRRLNLLLRLYDLDPDYVSEVIELESLAVPSPVGDLATVIREGVEFWKEGDVPRALASVFAVREHVASDSTHHLLRQKGALLFAIYARGLGKTRLARKLVEDLLCGPPDPTLLVDTLVLASSLWSRSGSRVVAWALIAKARSLVDPGDLKRRAQVTHQEAKFLVADSRYEDASRALEAAMLDYAASGDDLNALGARILRIAVLEHTAGCDAAIAAARETIVEADRLGFGRQKTAARIELGRLLSAYGRGTEGVDELRRAEAAAELLDDPRLAAEARGLLARTDADEPASAH